MIEDRPKPGSRDLRPRNSLGLRKNLTWLVVAIVAGIIVTALGMYLRGGCGGRPAAAEVFEGITYGCEPLDSSEEGSGVLHWIRIDLTAQGIGLYVTPLDPIAVSEGWQYRLRRVGEVVEKERLAVAVNATLFVSNPRWGVPMVGDLANGVEPVVANRVASHMWDDAYLLWFDDQLTPHLRPSKPITPTEFAMARWGIGGQDFWLRDGRVWPGDYRSRIPDARTAVAVDVPRKLLFLAVGTHISPRLIFQQLAKLGAKDGMLLDGGNSSSVAIGKDARGISPGVVFGYWRPVATHFGVRAQRLGAGRNPP